MILTYLSTKDLLLNCAPVCKHWYSLIKSPGVHRNVTCPNSPNVVPFLQQASLMDGLCLKLRHFEDCDAALLAIRDHSNLTSLTLARSDSMESCVIVTLSCYDIIESCFIVSPSCFGSLSSAHWWKNLSKIHMTFDEDVYKDLIQTKEFKAAIQELGSTGNVTDFAFGSCYKDPHCESPVSQDLLDLIKSKSFFKLKHLTICDSYSASQFEEIIVARRDTLQSLVVPFWIKIGDEVLFLRQCQKLTSLTYKPCKTSDIHVFLPIFQNLHYLEMDFFIAQNFLNLPTTKQQMPNLKKIKICSHGANCNLVNLKFLC